LCWRRRGHSVACQSAKQIEEVEMSSAEVGSEGTAEAAATGRIDQRLEVVVVPVSDVDRSKEFYESLGWRLDADIVRGDDFRVVQFTPPGSGCSVSFGKGVSAAAPGSAVGELIVSDIVAARAALADRGVDVSDVYHGSPFNPAGRISGPDPERQSYMSYAAFTDPDGNAWLLQEVTVRPPGRIDSGETSYVSAADLAGAMRRASVAHGAHEQRTGEADENWPDWYAAYMVAEATGTELPR
jgi:catechol 2,3-dioxygenase-like lactoylglutathione lyase family enzyme